MKSVQRGASILEFCLVLGLVALLAFPTMRLVGIEIGSKFSCTTVSIFPDEDSVHFGWNSSSEQARIFQEASDGGCLASSGTVRLNNKCVGDVDGECQDGESLS